MLFTRLVPGFVFKTFAVIILIRALANYRSYTFSVKQFKEIAAKHVGSDTIENIVLDLRRVYGKAISQNLYWIPFSAGGLNLKAKVLFPGVNEQITVFSTPVQTSGRGGFHYANSTCTVLNGEVVRFNDNFVSFNKESYPAGKNFRHGEFESYIYEVAPNTAVICYSRGVLPVSAIWPTVGAVSNGDIIGVLKLGFVSVEPQYSWIVDIVKGAWNRNAPKQWRTEL